VAILNHSVLGRSLRIVFTRKWYILPDSAPRSGSMHSFCSGSAVKEPVGLVLRVACRVDSIQAEKTGAISFSDPIATLDQKGTF